MLDKLVIRIPLNERLCFVDSNGKAEANMEELLKLGVRLQAMEVEYCHSTGDKKVSSMSVPFESIPSSNSTVATKIFNSNQHTWPFLEVKASPAKALQGHNVFGFECIATAAQELLESVWFAYPDLREHLDFHLSEVVEMDCTYFYRAESHSISQQIINFLRNVSNGQTRVSKRSDETTVYYNIASDGKQTGRHKSLKVYLKYAEFINELNELKRLQSKNNLTVVQQEKLRVMDNPELIEFTKNMVRFEATIKKRMMQKFGIPTLLTELIGYQKRYNANLNRKHTLIQALHKEAFKDIFKALGKKTMRLHNDDEIKNALRAAHGKQTPKGNMSYTVADKAFGLYLMIKNIGYTKTKEALSKSTFFRQLGHLTDVISKAQLQNMEDTTNNVVPFVRYVDIDFSKQAPDGYVAPQSVLEQRYATQTYIRNQSTPRLRAVGE